VFKSLGLADHQHMLQMNLLAVWSWCYGRAAGVLTLCQVACEDKRQTSHDQQKTDRNSRRTQEISLMVQQIVALRREVRLAGEVRVRLQ
jgi:hypothetical protein